MRIQFYVGLALVLVACGGWAVAYYRGLENDGLEADLQRLEQDKHTLQVAYEYLSDKQARLNQLYAETRRETDRVQANLEQQIRGIRDAEADACADAPVSADRIEWLRQPVWDDTPAPMPGDS